MDFNEALKVCPQAVILAMCSALLFFVIPPCLIFVEGKRARTFVSFLAPVPLITWVLTPQISMHQSSGNMVILLISALLWYATGLRLLKTPKHIVLRILFILLFTTPVLLGQWVAWGMGVEVLEGSSRW